MAITIEIPILSSSFFFLILFGILGSLIYNIFISIFTFRNKDRDKYRGIIILKIGSIITFIVLSILFVIPYVTGVSSSEYPVFFMSAVLISSLYNLPLAFTMGGVLLIFWNKNRSNPSSKYIMYAGIFWICYFVFRASLVIPAHFNNSYLLGFLDYLEVIDYAFITYYAFMPFLVLGTLAAIFVIIYGYNNREKYFTLAGFGFIILYAFWSVGLIPYYIELFIF